MNTKSRSVPRNQNLFMQKPANKTPTPIRTLKIPNANLQI